MDKERGNSENVSALSTVSEFSRKQAQKARFHSMKTNVLHGLFSTGSLERTPQLGS
jgi:hypothetical protein